MRLVRLGTGFLAAATIAAAARAAGSLSNSGALAACAVGTCVHGGLGLRGTGMMLAFFIPASLLSKVAEKLPSDADVSAKDGPRDAGQVLANGGVAALAALFGESPLARRIFAASLAAAASDTWSTEFGTTLGEEPTHILSGEPAVRGMSGNVSEVGFLGAAAGAAWMAAVGSAAGLSDARATFAAGFGGGVIDSILGATVQAAYRCTQCGSACETEIHCGGATELTHGHPAMTNDAVNALATSAAAVLMELSTPRLRPTG